eukprot:1430677-Rhodomonas_salina.1
MEQERVRCCVARRQLARRSPSVDANTRRELHAVATPSADFKSRGPGVGFQWRLVQVESETNDFEAAWCRS